MREAIPFGVHELIIFSCVFRLYYIHDGRIRVESETSGDVICHKFKGEFLGDFALLGDWQWTQLRKKDCRLKCDTMVSLMVLNPSAFEGCVKKCPQELADEIEDLYANHIHRKYGERSIR